MPVVVSVDSRESKGNIVLSCDINNTASIYYRSTVCARLAQLVRYLTANQEVPGSIPGLVEG